MLFRGPKHPIRVKIFPTLLLGLLVFRVSLVPAHSDSKLNFKIQWKKAVPNGSKLHFQVTKYDPKDTKKTSGVKSMEYLFAVNYQPPAAANDTEKPAAADNADKPAPADNANKPAPADKKKKP
jgi:hypothetical protein